MFNIQNTPMALDIDKISFGTKLRELELNSYVKSLSKYKELLTGALSLEGDIPIFIDTNILLRYYGISFSSRKSFYDFLEKYQKRIFVTSQVQKEFVKNREDLIERFFSETLSKLETNFKEEIKNKVQSYIDRNKILLDDFPQFESKLQKITKDIEKTQEQLSKELDSIKGKSDETKHEDKLLSLIQKMNLLNSLSEENIKFLKSEFDSLKKNIDVAKIKNELSKSQVAFPGLADVKEKPENPYGDYLLFHEIITYMQKNSTDAIFLTYDTTKGDWIKENKEPHSHYIQIVYLATGQNLFFIDAERFFNTHLHKNFNSLIAKRDYYSPTSEYEINFILSFIGLERIIRTIAEFVVIDNSKYCPLLKLIDIFVERQYIEKKVKQEFHELMYFRNMLVHEQDIAKIHAISDNDFLDLSSRLERMINQFNDLYRNL